jgi:succinate-acetate transporter protein
MKEKAIKRWEATRMKGRKKFILFQGVLGWGILTGIIWVITMRFVSAEMKIFVTLPIALIIFPVAGYAWGALVWNMSEKKYLEATYGNE